MGLIFIDGFGLYTTGEIGTYWRNPVGSFGLINTVDYRTAPGCISPNVQGLYRGVTEPSLGHAVDQYGYDGMASKQNNLVIGAAVRFPSSLGSNFVFRFGQTTVLGDPTTFNAQCSLILLKDGTFAITVGAFTTIVALCDPSFPITASNYYFIEWKVTIAHAGFAEVRINGQVVLSQSLDLQVLSSGGADTFAISGAGGGDQVLYDDLYLLTPDGLSNYVDFIGDSAVREFMPSHDGQADFTPHSNPAHWQNVDEIPPDGDTSYNQSTGSGSADSYGTTGVPTNLHVLAAQNWFVVDDPADAFTVFRPYVNISGSGFSDSIDNTPANPTYVPQAKIWPADPVHTLAWTTPNFNLATFGVTEV